MEFNLTSDLRFVPEEGKLLFKDTRMVIMNSNFFSNFLKAMIDFGGVGMAKVTTRMFWEQAGREDALFIKKEFEPDTDLDWLALGPTIHSWMGLVKATPTSVEFDRKTGKFFMQGNWENSFIADSWLSLYGESKEPVCWMLSSYATGYASAFFGMDLLCKETMCIAKGDPHCQFTIKNKDAW